ncbi:MAG: alginate export family protein [Pseudomonadales bacterium]|nr:alginate export family protein [Pseudomonadales bacterium]
MQAGFQASNCHEKQTSDARLRMVGTGQFLAICLAGLLSMASLPSQAQEDKTGPWRVNQALDTPGWLSVSGEQRTRYSHLENQFRPGLGEDDEAISLRTLLRLDFRLQPGVTLVTELQDSRAFLTDRNSGASTIVVNTGELLQAHVALNRKDVIREGDELDLKLGRFTMDLGGRRLIARNRYRNTIQNYSGISVDWHGANQSRLMTFAMLPLRVEPAEREDILDNNFEFDEEDSDLILWGAFYEHAKTVFGARLELYFFGLNESDDRGQPTRNRELYTPGIRFIKSPRVGQWDFDIENTLQFGERRASSADTDTEDLDVFAHFSHIALGYTFDSDWNWRLSAELDYASGEESASDGDANRFDSLFGPRRSDFGPTGIYGILGRENIISSGLRLGFSPNSRLDAYISWRANQLDEKTDTFARSNTRDPLGQSGNFAGHQIEFRTRYWLIPQQIRYEIGAAVFLEGRFLRNAPNATDTGNPVFVYTDISFSF